MPRPRPPHLHRQVTRHGRVAWYVRARKGPRIRIRSGYGTDAFWIEYRDAMAGTPKTRTAAPKSQTLAWGISRYRTSSAWAKLSPRTRRVSENIYNKIIASAGDITL